MTDGDTGDTGGGGVTVTVVVGLTKTKAGDSMEEVELALSLVLFSGGVSKPGLRLLFSA